MGQEATVVGGGTPKTLRADYFGGDIPWITPADLSGYKQKYISAGARNITKTGLDNSGAKLMPAGTVLFSSRAPIGYVAIAANPVSTNQGFKSFVLKGSLTSDFVYYYLQHAKKLAVELASGTTFQEISGKNAARIPIPVPPLSTQNTIVAEIEKQFTRLDAGVAALRRVQANLKRYRAAVLKAACEGRLVPTEAELARAEGRTYETGEQLLARILADRRKNGHGRGKYKEPAAPDTAKLPELPPGWGWASTGQVCGSVRDGTHDTPAYTPNGVPLVTSKNLTRRGIDFKNVKLISEHDHMEISHRSGVEAGDVLFAMIGTVGNPCEVKIDVGFSIKNVGLFKRNTKYLNPTYLRYWLESPLLNEWLEPRLKGSTQKFAPLGLLRGIPMPYVSLVEQNRIVAEAERHLSGIEKLEAAVVANLQRATRLRQAILRQVFTA